MTSKNDNFYFAKSISDEDSFILILIPKSGYELKSINNDINRIIIDEDQYTEANFPFTIKPYFSALVPKIEMSTQGTVTSVVPGDSKRDLFGFNAATIYEESCLSPDPVDILSFDKIFLECDVAQGMIYRGK